MTQALLEISGLAGGYPGRPVLSHVDLTLAPGERLALLGANGAGKSTLLHLILGLLPRTGGTITALGKPVIAEPDFVRLRAQAGLVFQDPDDQLFCPTVLEDVMFGALNLGQSRAAARHKALATLDRLALGHLAERVTHRLSGGEKRLVSIAAVLAMEPAMLLLDEPTNGLDAEAYERLVTILSGLPQAMLIVAHDAQFVARLASRAVLIQDGRSAPGVLHTHPHDHPHLHVDLH